MYSLTLPHLLTVSTVLTSISTTNIHAAPYFLSGSAHWSKSSLWAESSSLLDLQSLESCQHIVGTPYPFVKWMINDFPWPTKFSPTLGMWAAEDLRSEATSRIGSSWPWDLKQGWAWEAGLWPIIMGITNYRDQDFERFKFKKIYKCLKPMLTASSTRRHNVGGLDVSSAFDVFLCPTIESTLTERRQRANPCVCSSLNALPKELFMYHFKWLLNTVPWLIIIGRI